MEKFQQFTVDGSAYGPYPARPVMDSWHSYDTIAVTRRVAETIVDDLNQGDKGCGLVAEWRGSDLVFVWDKRYRGDEGDETVAPGPDGLYEIGGLWPWTEWKPSRLPTAGSVLLAALADRGITAYADGLGMSYALPLDPETPAREVCNRAHLLVADRSPSTDHDPATHTGWTVVLHDDSGQPVGSPLYTAARAEQVDCVAESATAAEFIADWLTSPQR
ncbi:hypothetical protein [Streptomyces sp. NPDC001089]